MTLPVASPELEDVWLSANAHLPLFVAHDHPALELAAQELGVRVTIAGSDASDIPGLMAGVPRSKRLAFIGTD